MQRMNRFFQNESSIEDDTPTEFILLVEDNPNQSSVVKQPKGNHSQNVTFCAFLSKVVTKFSGLKTIPISKPLGLFWMKCFVASNRLFMASSSL
jgi:hypothetical protein